MKTVDALMNPTLLYIREGDHVSRANARRAIRGFGVTAVPILDHRHAPVGVATLEEIEAEGDLSACSPVVTVPTGTPVEEASRKLAAANAHQLVVVDDDGVALGIVSATDFARELDGLPPTHPAPFARP